MTVAHRTLRISSALALVLSLHAIGSARAATNNGLCLRDAAGISQGNICTANDVRIARFDVLGTCSSSGSQNGKTCVSGNASDPCIVQGGTCVAVTACILGQQITLPIRATMTAGAKDRYDIGAFVAQDGGDAKGNPSTIPHGGMCYRDYLHPTSTTNNDLNVMGGHGPYYNGEIGVVPTDTCGDVAQNQTAVYDFAPITITCRDDDHNNILDVGTCISWDSNNSHTCNSEADTAPSQSSKCRCESISVGIVTVCGDGVVGGAEQCDEGANNGTAGSCCTVDCRFKTGDTTCRPAAGGCDVPEVCTGSSGSCPADGFKLASTVCRAAAGACDLAESCTGSSANCPADAKSSGVCRPSAGNCDVAESCDGVSNDCPADGFRPSSTTCRASTGECDPAENCTGSSATCPSDARTSTGTACTADTNPCTLDQCDGTSAICQHPAGNAGTVCRASAGSCDVAETCTGTSTTCPADGFASSSTECRASTGECDSAESCPGNGPTCPPDTRKSAGTACTDDANPCTLDQCDGTSATCQHPAGNAGTVCRAEAGVCDVAETCTGSSAACPADGFASSSTLCRASEGECDVAENCTGNGPSCPDDGRNSAGTACTDDENPCTLDQCDGTSATCQHPAGNAGTVCRTAAGSCDVAETCTGSSTTCPADGFASSSTECRASTGECDSAENCPGDGPACPPDTRKSAGMACTDDTNPCTLDQCDGTSAACQHPAGNAGTVCRAAAGSCDVAETCAGSSTTCPADGFASSSTECRAAAGVCDVAETCTGSSPTCPADGFVSSTTICRASAGECDPAENCTGNGASCPGDTRTSAGTACSDDANPCTLDQCDGTGATCQHPAGNAGTICRAAAGMCDVAETCTGRSTTCPADGFASSSTECRASTGECDPAESCPGNGPACPRDTRKSGGTACTADTNPCTLDQCDGTSPTCQHPAGNAGTVCRAAAGVCDVAETCTGSSATCPADGFASSSTVCRSSAGVCDLTENCSGSSALCPNDAKSTAVCRTATGECDLTESCDGSSNSCPSDMVKGDGTPCTDTDEMSCTTAACVQGQCNQMYRSSCGCSLAVTKAGCVVPSNGADCDGQVTRMALRYTRMTCVATHDSQGAGKVSCTDSASLTSTVRIQVTSASDPSKIYADVSGVPVGGTVTATAANAGATTIATSTRVKVFSGTATLLQEIVYDTSCAQTLNLGDQFGSVLLVGLKTTLGSDLSYDPSQCSAALPVPAPAPNCLGKIEVVRLRYDGGGCAAMMNSQAAGKVTCSQPGNAPFLSPARIRVTDGAGSIVWLDTGTPASIQLGDVFDVIAANVAGKTTLATDTIINVLNASGTVVEQVKLKTDCSQPVNLDDQYGGFTVFGMRTTNGGAVSLGSEVNYSYTITNNGTAPASTVTAQDDKLGTLPGTPIASLPVGASMTLSAGQLVDTTTLNTVTVSANGGMCTAEAKAAVLASCMIGYPYASTEPRTSVAFNESSVLRKFQPAVAGAGDRLMVFYNDEHALTLGVRQVIVKSTSGTTQTPYTVSPLNAVPSSVLNPSVGTMALDGDQAGTDTSACTGFTDRCDRPMYPALFITDVTDNPDNRSSDWQFGGTPIGPHAVYGTWKAAVRTVDKTKNPPLITVTPDPDPAKNDWNLGSPDPVPAGLANEGYGAELVWNVNALGLTPGRVYRVQFMVHDGDQNKTGGDAGEDCATVFIR